MSTTRVDVDPQPASTAASPPPGPVALALWASGLRCLLAYVALPALESAFGGLALVAGPVVLAADALGIGTAVYAVRRTASAGRWLTMLACVVLALSNVVGAAAVPTGV